MENRSEELKQYLVPGKHVHLVGIGGVSMRPLGLVLKGMGMLVICLHGKLLGHEC